MAMWFRRVFDTAGNVINSPYLLRDGSLRSQVPLVVPCAELHQNGNI